MASATRKTIEKTVRETQSVALELTPEEAEWLRQHLFRAGNGHPYNIFRALNSPTEDAPADDNRPVAVGDRVRILEANTSSEYNGRVGTVGRIDDEDPWVPFRVNFSDGDYEWAKHVERVND